MAIPRGLFNLLSTDNKLNRLSRFRAGLCWIRSVARKGQKPDGIESEKPRVERKKEGKGFITIVNESDFYSERVRK